MKKTESLPIMSPCGDAFKVGMKVYLVEIKDVTTSKGYSEKITKWSGDNRAHIRVETVVDVNESKASRSFILRSDRGCENTYSVKDNCLPKYLFTSIRNAREYAKGIIATDIEKMNKHLAASVMRLERDQKNEREEQAKINAAIKKLKAFKF